MRKIRLSQTSKAALNPNFKIFNPKGQKLFDYKKQHPASLASSQKNAVEFDCNLIVKGDFKFLFVTVKALQKEEKLCWCWLNSVFIGETGLHVCLNKEDLDGAVKDSKHRTFPKEFKVELFFDRKLTVDADECIAMSDDDEYLNQDLEEGDDEFDDEDEVKL